MNLCLIYCNTETHYRYGTVPYELARLNIWFRTVLRGCYRTLRQLWLFRQKSHLSLFEYSRWICRKYQTLPKSKVSLCSSYLSLPLMLEESFPWARQNIWNSVVLIRVYCTIIHQFFLPNHQTVIYAWSVRHDHEKDIAIVPKGELTDVANFLWIVLHWSKYLLWLLI